MTTRRVLLLTILAVTVLVKGAVRISPPRAAGYCYPACPLYDVWDPRYWLFGCDSCPPNPPDAG